MSEDKVGSVIIGAGVVGCALAQKLTEKGDSPFVLEAGPRIAEGVTSRNSGVIHAGIYYPPGSLKAKLCIRGKTLLKEWCSKKNVPWLNTGKFIVGAREDEGSLAETLDNAIKSGATGVRWAKPEELASEPALKAEIGLLSEETGIVDSYEFSRSLLDEAEKNGAQCLTSTKVESIERFSGGGYLLSTSRGPIRTERVFNAAGLYSDEIAKMVGINKYKIYPWRGDYFRIPNKWGFKRLIYPVKKKNAPGLGIHLTLELDGSCRLGPDVEFCEKKDAFDAAPEKIEKFYTAASAYIKGLNREYLQYDTCGIRPKLRSPADKMEHDFVISEDLPDFINLVGIESPGLTAAMAIAEMASAL